MTPSPAQTSLKDALQAAGISYGEVAQLAGVSWRMVKFVIDGQRTSGPVLQAIEHLASRAPRDVEGLVVALILWWQERHGRPMGRQEDRWLRANLAASLSFLGVPEVWRRMKERPQLLEQLVRPPVGEIVQAIDQGFKRASQARQTMRPSRPARLPRVRRISRARAAKRAPARSNTKARQTGEEGGDGEGPDEAPKRDFAPKRRGLLPALGARPHSDLGLRSIPMWCSRLVSHGL